MCVSCFYLQMERLHILRATFLDHRFVSLTNLGISVLDTLCNISGSLRQESQQEGN